MIKEMILALHVRYEITHPGNEMSRNVQKPVIYFPDFEIWYKNVYLSKSIKCSLILIKLL